MKTDELIKKLRYFENNYTSISNDEYIDDELINEIVKRLEELDKVNEMIDVLAHMEGIIK